jgi:hypothetical protein
MQGGSSEGIGGSAAKISRSQILIGGLSIMRDALGNRISDRSILCWHPDAAHLKRGLIVQAVSVSDGGITLSDSGQLTPPMLIIQVMIPVGGVKPGAEAVLEEFLCVVNPAAEAAIEGMLERGPGTQRKQ